MQQNEGNKKKRLEGNVRNNSYIAEYQNLSKNNNQEFLINKKKKSIYFYYSWQTFQSLEEEHIYIY